MSEEIELSIVIINYKTPGMLIDCLESVVDELSAQRQVVVVDNHSCDGSIEKIENWIKDSGTSFVTLVESGQNSGFSGGNNIGIKHQKAAYYLLLNSDTLVRRGAISILLDTAKEDDSYGLISPSLEWPDAERQISCFKFHTPYSELINAAQTGSVTSMLSRWNVPIELDTQRSFPEWTSFACVLVKSVVVESIGLMDEGYFLYYEDVDYCFEAKKQGWKVVNEPSARVVHLRGGSGDVKKNTRALKRLPKYVYASRSRYYRKQFGFFGVFFANSLWIVGRVIARVNLIFGKRKPACDKQAYDIWTNFFNPMDSSRNK